jgi:hypothetical protein
LWHLQKLLYNIIVGFTLSIILLYPLLFNPRIVSTGLIFPFTYMYTYIHPPTLSPYILNPPTGTNTPPPPTTCSAHCSLIFKKNFIIHLFTCVYIVWVISPLSPSLPLSLPHLTSRQKLFCPYL